MDLIHPNNYVSLILNSKIQIENVTEDKTEILKKLGGYIGEDRKSWVIDFSDEKHLAQMLSILVENELLFVGGASGWPPAEIIADLRDKNLVLGSFKEVTWFGEGKWIIKDR